MLEGKEDYVIVDGNADPQPQVTLERLAQKGDVTLLAVSVMPGPQMVAAIPLCREFRLKYPTIPIVWGGYFASLYHRCRTECAVTSISWCAAKARRRSWN